MPPHSPLGTGPGAARSHQLGVDALVDGRLQVAADAFRSAVDQDPCFAAGSAGLAATLAELDDDDRDTAIDALARVLRCSRRISRWERHHAEIVLLVLTGRQVRASALGREHLLEFPDDRVVRHVVVRWCGGSDDLG